MRMNAAHARKAHRAPALSHHRQGDVVLTSDGNIQHAPASGEENGDLSIQHAGVFCQRIGQLLRQKFPARALRLIEQLQLV